MLTRILAALGVAVWSFLVLSTAMALATSPGSWLIAIGVGVIAPIVLMMQINRAIAAHEESRRSVPGSREKEKELLGVLEERGRLTPATAAMRTSLTVDEASKMLETLARKGHLDLRTEEGVMAYALSEPGRQGLPGENSASSAGAEDGTAAPGRLVAQEQLEDPLSERELEVLSLLASGKTNSEVAGDLFVSVGTVKSHTGNIYRKLGARNRAEALTRARELGLIR